MAKIGISNEHYQDVQNTNKYLKDHRINQLFNVSVIIVYESVSFASSGSDRAGRAGNLLDEKLSLIFKLGAWLCVGADDKHSELEAVGPESRHP